MSAHNVVIVGGGSAGWITALFVKKYLPNSVVTVVESPEIGILGAGEGTTPNFISFLDDVGIPVSDLVKETSTTIKNGIKFTNWNGDGRHYYHGFAVDHDLVSNIPFSSLNGDYHLASVMAIAEEIPFTDFNVVTKMCEKNRVPQVYRADAYTSSFINPIYKFNRIANYAVHFDASKLANFLKKTAINRGVLNIESTITKINSNEDGTISSLDLKSGETLDVNFVFDCSGFHRLFIGKHFNSEWVSYKKYLPVDTAVPFFLDKTEELPPYTESIAMKYGWMWKIPLQDRYGCGYVFDSSLISEKEAAEEIEEHLGLIPTYPRANKGGFKFNSGYYKTTWVKNCIAIGLSSGFIEPLEATSIFSSLIFLRKSLNDLSTFLYPTDESISRFNKEVNNYTEEIFNFVYFHYLGERNDTEFWKKFKEKDNHPKSVQEILNLLNNFVLKSTDFSPTSPFGLLNWLQVGYGLNKLNLNLFKKTVAHNQYMEKYGKEFSLLINNSELASSECVPHNEFLKNLIA